jgi:hypothetical protein
MTCFNLGRSVSCSLKRQRHTKYLYCIALQPVHAAAYKTTAKSYNGSAASDGAIPHYQQSP